MIKLDGVSEKQEQEREGYKFHCHNCGLYLDGTVAYHSPEIDALTQFKFCPLCGISIEKTREG